MPCASAAVRPGDHAELTCLDATIEQLLPCCCRVGNHELKGLHRARRPLVLCWQIAGGRSNSLSQAGLAADVHVLVLCVVIQVEADPVTIELDRAGDIAVR